MVDFFIHTIWLIIIGWGLYELWIINPSIVISIIVLIGIVCLVCSFEDGL